MKIRHPKLIAAAGWLGFQAARALCATVDVEMHTHGTILQPYLETPPAQRYIYAMWHESLLVPLMRFGRPDLAALVSKHADGQMLQVLLRAMGLQTVEGSTNRGGVLAVRKIIGVGETWNHLVITVDGPRGPRRQVQPGVVYCASRGGLEIVPVGIGFQRCWRAKSWDRFAVPLPGSRVKLLFAPPIKVPDGLRTPELEQVRQELQRQLDLHTRWAEDWAKTGRLKLG